MLGGKRPFFASLGVFSLPRNRRPESNRLCGFLTGNGSLGLGSSSGLNGCNRNSGLLCALLTSVGRGIGARRLLGSTVVGGGGKPCLID